jgi:hypothetical protein
MAYRSQKRSGKHVSEDLELDVKRKLAGLVDRHAFSLVLDLGGQLLYESERGF